MPARCTTAADTCPHTNRARLGYDRAHVLLDKYAGPHPRQLSHSEVWTTRRGRDQPVGLGSSPFSQTSSGSRSSARNEPPRL